MELALLYPEWQSCGESSSVHHGALRVAETLFRRGDFYEVEVPAAELLSKSEGVLGLSSIAPRFVATLEELRRKNPSKLFTIGGTCGIEVAPVAYLNERYSGKLAVLWFDAHGDLNTPQSSPSGHFHGMALRTLLGEGPELYVSNLRRPLRTPQIFLVGTRELDPPEEEFISANNISVTTPPECASPQLLIDRINALGFDNLYLHLDLDVLNPESFPNSLMRTPGGPSFDVILELAKRLARQFNVVGFSVVEYCEHVKDDSLEGLSRIIQEVRGH